jgi:hypothetical protein
MLLHINSGYRKPCLQELTFEPDTNNMDRLRHNTVQRINELSYHYQVRERGGTA